MSNNITVVGIGEALWDMLPEGKKLGGAPANFAYHVSQFGFNSLAVSAIGNDALGHEIIDNFNDKQLNFIMPQVDFPTGTVQVSLDKNGIPQYDIRQQVAWDNIPFTDELRNLAERTQAVCFGSLAQRSVVSRNTICQFLNAMPNTGNELKIFDINLRQNFFSKEVIVESLRNCNILKINDEELEVVSLMFNISPQLNTRDKCRKLLTEYNLKMLILTCGVNGSYVFTSDSASFIETPEVQVADTVGAGDSFTATFIASLLRGKSVQQAHELAVHVSAYVCTQHGAMPTLPHHLLA